MNPYYFFPAELWDMMYNHMENPKAKLKLMRTHPRLYEQFGGIEKENELLFASALPIFLSHLESSGRQMNNEERNALKEVVLACRLVSSSSCKAVDKWMESYWEKSTGDHQPPSFFEEVRHENSLLNYFNRRALDKFTQDFQNDPCITRTPLLSRFVKFPISMWGTEVDEALNQGEFDVVQHQELEDNETRVAVFGKVGPHLRKLQVNFGVDINLNEMVMLAKLHSLGNVLELTPNLKSLVLTFPSGMTGPRLRNHQFSLPALPQLDHLKVKGGWKMAPKDILALVQEYFPRLQQLEFSDVVNFLDDYLGNADLFPELKLLKLYTQASSREFFETVIKLKRVLKNITAPNLTRIEFSFNLFFSFFSTWPNHKLGAVRKAALRSLNENPAYSRPEPEVPWEVTTIQGVEHSQNVTLIFSRRINQQQNTEDQPV